MAYGHIEPAGTSKETKAGELHATSCLSCGHSVPGGSFIESLLQVLRSQLADTDIDEYLASAREYLKGSGSKVTSYTRENPAKVTTGVAALALGAGLVYSAKHRHEEMQQMRQMIDSMMPQTPVPLPPQVLQARRNAQAREALFEEFGALTSADIGKMAGSKSPNRAALAHRWKTDGRIFAVPHQGANYFPGFQFSPEGQPLPVIASVLSILSGTAAAWEVALWFTGRNGWLDGRRPVDLLVSDPASVIAAAEREVEDLVF